MRKVGSLAIVIAAFVATVSAVPRYSAPVTQIGDSALNPAKAKPGGDREQNPENTILQRIKQDALSCKDEWSGSLDDLKALVDRAKQKYGRESTKHMGRNATMIVPANLSEMKKWLSSENNRLGNWVAPHVWNKGGWDGYHAKNADKGDGKGGAFVKRFGSGVEKYIVEEGDFAGAEVVYDKETGEIIKDWRMGTRNFSYVTDADHDEVDMNTHEKNPEYKYVGILVETDSSDPNMYYVVDGQTGKRMTWREAEYFPTTLSNEWKEMGLVCVPDDANDVIEPDECRDEAKCIDTAKLEELLKEGILFLKDLIAKGKRATNSQIGTHNKRVNRMVDELVNITKQINSFNVSAEEKKRISEEALADVVLLNSQFNSLCEQAKSMGLVNEATNGQKMELIKNVQGELSEISRDAQRAKDSSAKATVAPQRRTMTDEEAIRLLREDGSGIKAVADALKD